MLDDVLNKGIKHSRQLAKEKYEFMKTKMGITRNDLKI